MTKSANLRKEPGEGRGYQATVSLGRNPRKREQTRGKHTFRPSLCSEAGRPATPAGGYRPLARPACQGEIEKQT